MTLKNEATKIKLLESKKSINLPKLTTINVITQEEFNLLILMDLKQRKKSICGLGYPKC